MARRLRGQPSGAPIGVAAQSTASRSRPTSPASLNSSRMSDRSIASRGRECRGRPVALAGHSPAGGTVLVPDDEPTEAHPAEHGHRRKYLPLAVVAKHDNPQVTATGQGVGKGLAPRPPVPPRHPRHPCRRPHGSAVAGRAPSRSRICPGCSQRTSAPAASNSRRDPYPQSTPTECRPN